MLGDTASCKHSDSEIYSGIALSLVREQTPNLNQAPLKSIQRNPNYYRITELQPTLRTCKVLNEQITEFFTLSEQYEITGVIPNTFVMFSHLFSELP